MYLCILHVYAYKQGCGFNSNDSLRMCSRDNSKRHARHALHAAWFCPWTLAWQARFPRAQTAPLAEPQRLPPAHNARATSNYWILEHALTWCPLYASFPQKNLFALSSVSVLSQVFWQHTFMSEKNCVGRVRPSGPARRTVSSMRDIST